MVKPLPVHECYCGTCTAAGKDDGAHCVSCGGSGQIPTIQIDVSKLGRVDDDALVHAAEIIEHAGELFDLVKAHVKILQRCREGRGLTTAESAFLARGLALLTAIGGAR